MVSSLRFAITLLAIAIELIHVACVGTKCFEPDPEKAKFNYNPQSCLCKFSSFFFYFLHPFLGDSFLDIGMYAMLYILSFHECQFDNLKLLSICKKKIAA